MNDNTRKINWLVWGGLLLLSATLLLLLLLIQLRARASRAQPLPILGEVADFSLTNQNTQVVSLADLRGHVWVGDIIFTRCPGPCLEMSRKMKVLQDSLPRASRARLVTLTTDPTFDTPRIFQKYVQEHNLDAQPERWLFLTGTKQQIARLAVDSLKLAALEKPAAERESVTDLFIHSTVFVLVDKRARLRAIFESTGEGADFPLIKVQILTAIHRLENET
jgi:protein SCO1